MALMAMTGFAQKRQTGDVMYVYQKDGMINSFPRSEIVEMSYSNEGIDSVMYDEPVTQLIATADSIYRFALSRIDSISFVTPDAVYMPGVTPLEGELLQYVERCDSMTIYFAANTPANILPKVGDKLGIGFLNEKFPQGFAGVVKTVNGITVECEQAELEDIFETLYCVTMTEVSQGDNAARRRDLEIIRTYEPKITIDPIHTDFTGALENVIKIGSFAFKGENSIKSTFTPKLNFKAELVIRKPFGLRFSGDFSGEVNAVSHTGIYGSLEFAKDLAYSTRIGNFYGFGIDLKVGGFAKISGDITANLETRQTVKFSTGFALGTKGMVHSKPVTKVEVTENKTTVHSASLDGLLAYGAVVELGICWVKDKVAKGVFRAEFGPQYKSNIILTSSMLENANKTTILYDKLKDRTIQKYQAITTSWDFYLMEKYGTSIPSPWGDSKLTDEWDIVPKFRNVELVQKHGTKTAEGSAVAKGDCAFEHKVGMQLKDDGGRYFDMEDWQWLSEKDFKSGRENMSAKFEDLKDEETYKLYPTVWLCGTIPILASPSADLEKDDFPVRIVSFEQTGSHYSKQQGYEYEGKHYFYKFNATTTVELDSEAQNVKDWGYIYHDIYEVDKKISCANLGSNPYADTRYAYYYNGTERTVNLRPYVQYEGETEIKTGKPKTYEVEYTHNAVSVCPDANHPHLIDLGLPSGTLWSCCNVGASEPEDEGYEFMWGTTKPIPDEYYTEKKGRDRDYEGGQFIYYHTEDYTKQWNWNFGDITNGEYYDIPFLEKLFDRNLIGTTAELDIARTPEDAAMAYTGLQMPTRQQMQELLDNCSLTAYYEGHPSNPVSFKFTGPSGRSILLPSHYRNKMIETCKIGLWDVITITTRETYTYRAGYWSSTYDYDEGGAWYLAPEYNYFSGGNVDKYTKIFTPSPTTETITHDFMQDGMISINGFNDHGKVRPVSKKR